MRSWSYHLLALFVVLCWGMTLVSSKVLLNFGMQPWALVELRSVLAYGILIFLAPMQLYSGTMRGEITVALLGLTSIPLFFGLQTLALEHGTVSATASLIAMGPLLSGLLAMAALSTWKLHWMTFLGICTAATGTFLLYFDNAVLQDLPRLGFYFGLAAAAAYAVYSLVLRALADLPALFVMRKSTGYGILGALPFYLNEQRTDAAILFEVPAAGANLVFLALAATVIGYTLWHKAEQEIGAAGTRWYTYLSPVVGIIGGLWFLNEEMSYIGVMGAGMILCGVICAQTGLVRVAAEMAKRW